MKCTTWATTQLTWWTLALAAGTALAAPLAVHDFNAGNGSSPNGPGDPGDEDGCPDGEDAGDPVQLFSGDFVEERTDVFLPGRMLGVDVRFTYRGQSAFNGPYGYGWDMSYHRRLKRLDNGDIVLLTGTNRTGEFPYQSGSGTYANPVRFYGGLVANGNGTYTLTLPDKTVEQFDANGNMTLRVDRNGNTLQFLYSATAMPISGKSSYFVGQTTGVVAREYLLTDIVDTIGRTVTFNYDASNRLASIQWLGRTVSYTYDPTGTGDLISVTYPATAQYPSGNTIAYGYDANHNLTTITDAKSQTYLTNVYNAADRVTSQNYGGGLWGFVYGTSGSNATTTVTDPRNVVTKHTFNARGMTTITEVFTDGLPVGEPASYVTTYQYDAQERVIREVLPRGNAIEYAYSTSGKLTELRRKQIGKPPFVPDATDAVLAYTYEPTFDFPKTMTDARGNTVTYTYDYELAQPAHGNLRKITYPSVGGTIESTITYNAFGQVDTVTDPNGNVLKKVYDPSTGYLLQNIAGFGTALAATTQYAYDAVGNVTSVTDPNNRVATIQYDARERVIQVNTPLGYAAHMRYDANGNLQQVDHQRAAAAPGPLPALGTVNAADDWDSTIYTHNTRDETTSIRDDLGNVVTYGYDGAGNRTSIVDANGHAATHVIDERNLTWRIVDARAVPGTIEMRYDGNGNLTSYIDEAGNPIAYQYDDFDRPSRVTYADASFEQFSYDKNDNCTTRINAAGQTTTYVYDALNRATSKTMPSEVATYSYDLGSRLLSAADPDATVAFTYDALDRVATSTTTIPSLPAYVTSYTYDRAGNTTAIQYPDGFDLSLGYDTQNRLTYVGRLVQYAYDALDQRTSRSHNNTAKASYAYDAAGRVLSIDNDSRSGVIEHFGYSYDAHGNRTAANDRFGAHVYGNDEIDQLLSANHPAGFPFASATYAYDLVGNRTSVTGSVGAGSYTDNALNQYTDVAGVPFSYDVQGNLTSDGSRTYTYDEDNRLVSASGAFGTASYAYDALNRRVRRTVNGVASYYLYDQADLIQEVNSSGAFVARYVHGAGTDEPVVMDRGGQRYHYSTDALGSIVALTDDNGQVVERYAYDAYGQPSITNAGGTPLSSSAVGNRFMFTGREFDAETGVLHLRYRDYDPRIGRFLQRDPLGPMVDSNLYRYVSNTPLAFTDPWGLSKDEGWFDKILPFIPVIGSAKEAYDDFSNGRWGWGIFNTVLAITDLIPGKALATTAAKGLLWKTGSHTWKQTRRWMGSRGLAQRGQEVHHWLVPQRAFDEKKWGWLYNQPWNLMPMPNQRFHNYVEGKGAGRYAPWLLRRWHGTPDWLKKYGGMYAGSYAGKGINEGYGEDGAGCD